MKTNSSYLPLFFLCWAFLYTPLALLRGFPSEAEGRDLVVGEKPGYGQVLGRLGQEKMGISGFGCFFSVDGTVPGVWDGGDDQIVPFCLTDNRLTGYGTK